MILQIANMNFDFKEIIMSVLIALLGYVGNRSLVQLDEINKNLELN